MFGFWNDDRDTNGGNTRVSKKVDRTDEQKPVPFTLSFDQASFDAASFLSVGFALACTALSIL